MPRRSASYLLAALLLWAAAATHSQETYSLKRVFTAGETDTYRFEYTMEGDIGGPGEPRKAIVKLVYSEAIPEVRSDGTAVVVTRVLSGTIQAGSLKMPVPWVGHTVTTTFDPGGKVAKTETSAGFPMAEMFEQARGMMPTIPAAERSLRIGEEVSFEVPVPGHPDWHSTGKVKLVALQKPSATVPVPSLKVHAAIDIAAVSPTLGATHMEETTYYEPGTGKRLQGEAAGTAAKLVDGETRKLRLKVKVIRLPAGAPPKP